MKKENNVCIMDIEAVLLDENNTDNLFMTDKFGKEYEFEQVAVIPKEETLYCILKPVTKIFGILDDEAVVMKLKKDAKTGHKYLSAEEDAEVAIAIFDEYYTMLEEELASDERI